MLLTYVERRMDYGYMSFFKRIDKRSHAYENEIEALNQKLEERNWIIRGLTERNNILMQDLNESHLHYEKLWNKIKMFIDFIEEEVD